MLLMVNQEHPDVGRMVDQHGHGLNFLAQRRRSRKAAKKLFRAGLTPNIPESPGTRTARRAVRATRAPGPPAPGPPG